MPTTNGDAAGLRDLLVVLRTTADVNTKGRPGWYDKHRCIRSIEDAARVLRDAGGRVHLLALVDEAGGALPGSMHEVLAGWDERLRIRGGSARGSWKAMLRLLHRRGAARAHDAVYLVEDDHLHAPEALLALAQHRGDLCLLYTFRFRGEAVRVGSFDWRPADSGVSSFAISRPELLRSRRLMSVMSSANQAWDDLIWTTLLGPRHLDAAYVLAPFTTPTGSPAWHPRTLWNVLWRVIGFVWTRTRRPATAWGVDPNLATHAEVALIAPGVDWRAVAEGAGPTAHDTP